MTLPSSPLSVMLFPMTYHSLWAQVEPTLRADYARFVDAVPGRLTFLTALRYAVRNPVFGNVMHYRLLHARLVSGLCAPGLGTLLKWLVPHRVDVGINSAAEIGPGLLIYHGMALVVGSGVKAGSHLTLEHQVTLGNRIGSGRADEKVFPVLGDHVFVGCGAAVLGPITIGSDAKIGAGAVVINDVPPGATAVGVPAKVLEDQALPASDKWQRSSIVT